MPLNRPASRSRAVSKERLERSGIMSSEFRGGRITRSLRAANKPVVGEVAGFVVFGLGRVLQASKAQG